MLIYRVEHKDNGFGPYCTEACNITFLEILEKARMEHMFADYEHPSPSDDAVLKKLIYKGVMSNYHFGFETLEDLLSWWYVYPEHILNILRDFGFHIAVYDVEEHTEHCFIDGEEHYLYSYYLGHIQAVFNKKYAKLVETMEL